jgi:hypothetical protein
MEKLIHLATLELYQVFFVASIAYLILNLFNLGFKMYGNLKLDNKAKYVLTMGEKLILLFSFAIIIAYII